MSVIVKDELITLRDLQTEDISKRMYWETEDTEWQKWDGPWDYENMNEKQLQDYLEKYQRYLFQHANRIYCKNEVRSKFEIEANESKEYVGFVTTYLLSDDFYYDRNGSHLAIGLDICSIKDRNHGYGYHALYLAMRYLFDHGINEIYIQTWSGNKVMKKLIEKFNFELIELKLDQHTVSDKKYDGYTYRLRKEQL